MLGVETRARSFSGPGPVPRPWDEGSAARDLASLPGSSRRAARWWSGVASKCMPGETLVEALDVLAQRDPRLARDRLASLPEGFTVLGDLDLRGRAWVGELPKGLAVSGNLACFHDCSGLEALPEGFQVAFDLDLSGCVSVSRLPAALRVPGNLLIQGCPGLRTLPAGLEVEETMQVRGCPSFAELPAGLRVGHQLLIEDCPFLRSLAPNMEIGFDLEILDCLSFQSLPCQLEVGFDLRILGCPSWDGMLPPGCRLGRLFTDHHLGGIGPEQWRRQWQGNRVH